MKIKMLLFVAVICLVCTPNTFACDCSSRWLTAFEELQNSDSVFTGEVVGVKTVEGNLTRAFEVKLKVKKMLKGIESKEIKLHIGNSDCDNIFNKGEKYLVFAYLNQGALTTNGCTRTTLLRDAADEIKEIKNQGKLTASPAKLGNKITPRL